MWQRDVAPATMSIDVAVSPGSLTAVSAYIDPRKRLGAFRTDDEG